MRFFKDNTTFSSTFVFVTPTEEEPDNKLFTLSKVYLNKM